MKKYLAINEPKRGYGDIFEKVFDTLENANSYAEKDWNHLTYHEKKERHIYVAWVTEEYLNDYAFEENQIDWCAYHSLDYDNNCFDSERE